MFEELTQTRQEVGRVNKKKHPKMYHVVMYNDNVTPFEYVIMILMEVFNYDISSAMLKTSEIHKGTSSVIGTYDRKSAEDHCDKVESLNSEYGLSLLVTVEPAKGEDDEN